MLGATHVAIAVSCGLVSGCTPIQLAFMAGGALLPDLDSTRSIVGRILLPISIPLSKWLGHRGAFHSFWLWGIVCAIGWLYWPAYYIGGGAVLHIVA
ncbi:MAG: metal-dependent hydrolase, partial [Gammaproteobacteria bacterium]|nr:metal-dependent hydrolase [Gammaproteobacteria bacterium]